MNTTYDQIEAILKKERPNAGSLIEDYMDTLGDEEIKDLETQAEQEGLEFEEVLLEDFDEFDDDVDENFTDDTYFLQ